MKKQHKALNITVLITEKSQTKRKKKRDRPLNQIQGSHILLLK